MPQLIPPNLRAFNLLAVVIFERLYQSFPERIDISGGVLVLEQTLKPETEDEIRNAIPKVLTDTMLWLRDEGFIRFQDQTFTGDYIGVGLTLRGLTVLGYIPTAIEPGEDSVPLIQKIRDTLTETTGIARTEVIQKIVGKAFELGAGHLGL